MHRTARFIHSSDWQLGMTRAFMSDEAAARFSQARIDAIERLGALATRHRADFIVVAGDVFESNQLSRATVLRAIEAMKSLPVPVFLLPGNHDPLDGTSIFSTAEFMAAAPHIVVIRNSEPIEVPGIAGVEIVGAPWRTKHPSSDLCARLLTALTPTSSKLRVAVAHGQVDVLAPDATRPEIIDLATVEAAVHDGRIHYLALGDRHSVTSVGGSGRVWYCGAPVATAFDEVDPNKALLVELDEAGCKTTPLEVGDWHFLAEQRHLNGPEDLRQLADWIASIKAKDRTALKIGLTGSISLRCAAELDQLLSTQAELFASLRRRERTSNLTIIPDSLDEDSLALSGYARQAWEKLQAEAVKDPVAEDALRLFYRLVVSQTGDASQ
ncbi:MAG: DNA repair exonuclease [unclassified Hahellaceae]|nr:DNA repair exonuclease [Hahellaceae bacterium]|tara:strand:- start:11155 stop:12303 length:1149 start_codon:yes stop_codon:yes gene_type:complete